MTLNVQNDTGTTANADSYLALADFKAYHTARGNAYATYADALIEAAIIKATDHIDRRWEFVGAKLRGREQNTAWPRLRAYDVDGYLVEGIPEEVADACAEYAFRALSAPLNPDPVTGSNTLTSYTKKLGPIERTETFKAGAESSQANPSYPAADNLLLRSGLVVSGAQLLRG